MSTDRRVTRQHAEWLSLIDISGPFLSMPVLLESFPQGLDLTDDEGKIRRRVRLAYDEWIENQEGLRPDPAIHTQWLRFVLEEVLQMRPDAILEGQQIPADLCYESKERGEILRPLMVIRSPYEQKPRLLIQLTPHKQDLSKPLEGKQRNGSPATRMMELLRQSGVRLGLLTNGRQWMLIDAPANETTGYYSWDASLWAEEPLTLQAFRSLLGMSRFFNVPTDETLEALLTKSALKQQEVTDQLGDQVRRAVETLVHTMDQLDKEDRRLKKDQPSLLAGISEKELYEAALTVMMRLVFLLSAEERDLLQLGELLYDQNYAVSTLLKQLQEQADQQGEDVMGYRCDAWSRLLAVFRMVYGGVEHPNLHLPAYGGRLFDPDRFPFLEGRSAGTSWQGTPARPLKIDNRTVLHLLNALQYLQVRIGGIVEPRRLSFRGLDIEQIGHVYEGLLDHTARRAQTTILGLIGTSDSEPEATLEELEQHKDKGEESLLQYLEEITGRKATTIQKNLSQALEKQTERSKLMGACDNKQDLFERLLPFAGLLRKDTFGNYVIITPGSIYVTRGDDRRSTGTHYTPRSLTEPIVQHALDPLVYLGPAEGWPREQWQLRTAAEILDLRICDMAMGSGAFLVQTCRYLSEKLVEAWENVERDLNGQRELNGHPPKPQITPEGKLSQDAPPEELVPLDSEERLTVARRLVSERCLYGVDKNPMAAEMAKLSLWLITLAKNKPFTFLDHNLRCGDSLLGADERQLHNGSLDAKSGEITQMSQIRYAMQYVLPTVIQKRRQIATLTDLDITVIQEKQRLLKEADQALEFVKLGADLLIGLALSDPKRREGLQGTLGMDYVVLAKGFDEALHQRQTDFGWAAKNEEFARLRAEVDTLLKGRHPFHWPLEFPEVFVGKGDDAGFAAIVGNPPFQGGKKITGVLGTDYRDYLLEHLANGRTGHADLCSYFFLRATKLARQEGMCALLATNTIAQGDTREVGLDQIVASGWTIPRAIPSRRWPGEASLEVAHIWLRNGLWSGGYTLDDKQVANVTPFLTSSGGVSGKPFTLVSNKNKSFIGSYVLGMGFILTPDEAQALIVKDQRNKDVLCHYLNGEDLNSRSDQSPSRWIINFRDWSLEQAEMYPDCINVLKEKVKPERQRKNSKGEYALRKPLPEKWWVYADKRPALYSTIAHMERVLAVPLVSKYMICTWEPVGFVYSHMLGIITTELNSSFALIQSTFHDYWARVNGSTLETRMRYTPSDCFETFPFPANMDSLEDIGKCYYTHRQSIMLANQEGLTKTYNRFHDPHEHSAEIVKLRELHTEMDEAVAHAYGWDDLELGHGFHETKQGMRYTISEAARREVLDRLLSLNHERHEEEVKAGLFEAKGAKSKGTKAKKGKSVVSDEKAGTSDGGLEQGALF
jgi:hypothetical protein